MKYFFFKNTTVRVLSSLLFLTFVANVQILRSQEVPDSIVTDSVVLPDWGEQMKEKLYLLSEEADRSYYNTGISVYDLTGDSLIFAYNQQKMMRPASTQKLLKLKELLADTTLPFLVQLTKS